MLKAKVSLEASDNKGLAMSGHSLISIVDDKYLDIDTEL